MSNQPSPNQTPATFFVTGASGFLGKAFVSYLLQSQHTVLAGIHQTHLDITHPNLICVSVDLFDRIGMENLLAQYQVQYVIHCAAKVSYAPKDRDAMYQVNVEGTAELVNTLIDYPDIKLLHVSSIATLGKERHTDVVTEDSIWDEDQTVSTYSKSKYYGELEVWRGIEEGLNAVIINPGIILGTGGDWNKGSVQLMTLAAQSFPFYSLGQTGFVDVMDVVKTGLGLLLSPVSGEKFTIIEGNYTFRDIMNKMAKALNKPLPRYKAPQWLSEILWRYYTLKSHLFGSTPKLTKESARTAQKTSTYSNTKVLRFLPGFTFKDIQQTIEDMAKAYQQSHKLP